MIDDLDKTLEELLRRELPPQLLSQVTISFAAPDGHFPPSSVALPAVDLFLYDVRENRDLRSNEWQIERQSDGTATRTRPPVRVDCSYLVTAWPSEGSTTPALDEHRLLGAVMQVLLRFPTLPAPLLKGALAGQQPAPPTTSLQPGPMQSLGDFWQALGGKPKATLSYTVTLAVLPEPPVPAGPLVREKVFRFDVI
jgi:hypothetical protein